MKKAMISQPMGGLTVEKIERVRNEARKKLNEMGYEVVDTRFRFSDTYLAKTGVIHISLHYLAASLMKMATCDVVYFCKGWENARGCVVEREAAERYGLAILDESQESHTL